MFVVSSTGEGDPPENFESFWSTLHDTPPQNLKYALLGLGDSNYTEFGGFPNALKQFLDDSGAKSFYEYQVRRQHVFLACINVFGKLVNAILVDDGRKNFFKLSKLKLFRSHN